MNHLRFSKRKGSFVIAVSWLLVRLWWSFEISRLAILRVRQKTVVNRVTFSKKELPVCSWIFDRNRLFCISVSHAVDELIIRETEPLERN